jgi:hypothetical protein
MIARPTPRLATMGWQLRNAVLVLFAPPAFRHGHAHPTFAWGGHWLRQTDIAIAAAQQAGIEPKLRAVMRDT